MIGSRDARHREVQGGLTLALHATRSASPASELHAIETILEKTGEDAESATIKEIAAQTGISVQTVRRRLRLRALTPNLRRAFDEARISTSVAEAAARLPAVDQEMLERRLERDALVTLADVRELAREQRGSAARALPGGVFADQAVAWSATVRGHLVAALDAIPPDETSGSLIRSVEEAITACERLHDRRS